MRQINDYIHQQDVALYMKDPDFLRAAGDLAGEGLLVNNEDYRYHSKESFDAWAKSEEGGGMSTKEKRDYIARKQDFYGTNDWYAQHGSQGISLDERDISTVMNRVDENTYNEQSAEQQAQLDAAYERSKADSEAAAAEQRAFMEEMMNQPVYMPKQAALPTVQKPMAKQNPILPAPAAPTPMNITPPPAPELTAANNKMAIVRTPQSTKARQRRATRGTSSLTN